MAASRIPISALIRNPFVRAAFIRAERDEGGLDISLPTLPVLIGGAGAIVDSASTREAVASLIEGLIDLLDASEPDLDAEPGTWIEQAIGREYETVVDENLEEQHDREEDPAEHGLADNDAMNSEELCFSGLRFDGKGRHAARALLATHEAFRFSAGAELPTRHVVNVTR